MKKHFIIFVIIFLVAIGYAAVNTVLDIKGNINVAENIEDFKMEITNLKINNNDSKNLISKDKKSFTFTGSGNDTINYTVTNYSYQYDANIVLTCIPDGNVSVEQINNLPAQERSTKTITSTRNDEITCTINIEKVSRTEYAEDMCKFIEGTEWTFDYTGSEQEFSVPCEGEYRIELWGASGEYLKSWDIPSYGAYVKGDIFFEKSKKIYIQVGGKPTNVENGGYNGGGTSYSSGNDPRDIGSGGGGATDIRFIGGTWNNFESLKSRIIVAAGSNGSQCDSSSVGNAGGLIGYIGYNTSYGSKYGGGGGSQISGGRAATSFSGYKSTAGGFGYGGNGSYASDAGAGGGGGGGYYGGGGGSGAETGGWGGGGGSSFISGHNGCDAIAENSIQTNIIHTGQPNHYSGYVFTDTIMIDGAGYKWTNVKGAYTGMPTHDGTGTMTGNSGNGYAKITYLGEKNLN